MNFSDHPAIIFFLCIDNSSNDGQSNLSHNPYGMSQPNAYPGMPPPLPSEFYSMHMGQGQYLGDTGLREQQHQVHSQQMNGTNDRRNSQGAPTKPSTFERPLEQRRSKNSSPDLPVSTPSAAASQSIEASIKVKKEKKSRTEKKKARIGEGSNAGNVNKQTEGNEAKEEGNFMFRCMSYCMHSCRCNTPLFIISNTFISILNFT